MPTEEPNLFHVIKQWETDPSRKWGCVSLPVTCYVEGERDVQSKLKRARAKLWSAFGWREGLNPMKHNHLHLMATKTVTVSDYHGITIHLHMAFEFSWIEGWSQSIKKDCIKVSSSCAGLAQVLETVQVFLLLGDFWVGIRPVQYKLSKKQECVFLV